VVDEEIEMVIDHRLLFYSKIFGSKINKLSKWKEPRELLVIHKSKPVGK
jgi:hypothetical protein